MRLTGKTVLITGGTSGIGFALASQLLARGNTVVITGRTEARLAAARGGLPGVHTFVCDQSDPAAVTRVCEEVTRAFPDLDVLVNNAGIGLKRDLHDAGVALHDLDAEIRTNVSGPIHLVHLLLPHLKTRKSALIVNVTSGLAFIPLPLKPIYCATKAAMHSYTQSLRVQLRRTNVRVVELAPPATKTEFNKGQEDMNSAAYMDVDKLAQAAIRGFEQGRDEVLPGASPILRLIGRLNPHAVIRRKDAEKLGLELAARA